MRTPYQFRSILDECLLSSLNGAQNVFAAAGFASDETWRFTATRMADDDLAQRR